MKLEPDRANQTEPDSSTFYLKLRVEPNRTCNEIETGLCQQAEPADLHNCRYIVYFSYQFDIQSYFDERTHNEIVDPEKLQMLKNGYHEMVGTASEGKHETFVIS